MANQKNSVLVLDGLSLEYCMQHDEAAFFEATSRLSGVLCCRCSPVQKTLIVRKMKEYTGMQVASIGDGGNDVGMIQEADVGIGIVGKEGKQASLAADFSIERFNDIIRLLFWHGRLSYIRTALLGQFVVHRGLVVAIIQAIFSLTFYFCSVPVFNSYLLLGYATYYTFLPVFCLVFDKDIDNEETVFKYPNLYQTLQKGRLISAKTLLIWTAQSLYQGAVVMLSAILFFQDSFVNIVIINFSALLMIELLNLYTELKRPNCLIYCCLVLSFMVYVASIWLFHDYFDISTIDWQFVGKVLLVALVAWLPTHLIKCISERIDPSDASKIQKR